MFKDLGNGVYLSGIYYPRNMEYFAQDLSTFKKMHPQLAITAIDCLKIRQPHPDDVQFVVNTEPR
ncbi:MAG: hypothetical protein A2934_05940 [Candidatus Sungbacteria bacterium RIFCSPLOWO2_01_FULL_47_10]|uniref:Uncharacterized protein n=1 Tax=Candidatus Sungbacteria bacterium RIFCSPLOWO2_01_FULL_47_10 TaxID=1802276 RepID=A0A1G2L3V0_9BACT|nr:MAG: hypothetical protein A2934_05940 [Candidatus Sungbacteria bacterium RIFCSPLOWO2_01_FULL_47_10]